MDKKIESTSTILVRKYRDAAAQPATDSSGYKGLRIHALPGLHEFAAERALEQVKKGGSVLDLAAGSGAMSQRLSDLGFQVTATDYVPENFRRHDSMPFITADLNESFSHRFESQFDAIVALEIIEHLENPRHFARECYKVLAPGGKLFLSTPNVDSPASIASFICSGTFLWFSDGNYRSDGHITPLCQWQLKKVFNEAGFTMRWEGSFGDIKTSLKGSPRLRLLAGLLGRLSPLSRALHGEIYFAVLESQKTNFARRRFSGLICTDSSISGSFTCRGVFYDEETQGTQGTQGI